MLLFRKFSIILQPIIKGGLIVCNFTLHENQRNLKSFNMRRILFSAVVLAACSTTALAQSGTNSPYSQFGLGAMTEQTSGFNRGMNGLGLGFHEHNQINFLNPASYSSLDSLSFIFDVGMSGQITNFEENGKKQNAKNGNLEYVVAGFRVLKHVGVSFGVVPFTNVGYNYSNSSFVGNSLSTSVTNTYSGSGGLHQVYLGTGWEPFKGFAFGANVSYLWGNITRSVVNSYSDASVNTLSKYYAADVRSYRIDVGMQYTAQLSAKDAVTLGITYGLGHKMKADPSCTVVSKNLQTGVADSTVQTIRDGYELPTMIGAGLMYNHHNRLKIGLDYSLQKWAKIDFPEYSVVNDQPQYALKSGLLKDRHKFTFGGEFCPNEMGRGFAQRMHYRAGVSYATPYYKINGTDGPKEISASLGFGIPIINTWNNRSMLNISVQWARQSVTGFITENTFRLNVGLTFNERWFAKWKLN